MHLMMKLLLECEQFNHVIYPQEEYLRNVRLVDKIKCT